MIFWYTGLKMEAACSSEASAVAYQTLSQPRKLQSGQSKTSKLTNMGIFDIFAVQEDKTHKVHEKCLKLNSMA
jgi:hypothetical protein